MKKTKIENFRAITMKEFLEYYVCEEMGYSFPEEIITKLAQTKATHYVITELNIPYCKRIPNDIITEDMLLSGDIILVADFKSTNRKPRVAPYIRPSILRKQEENKKMKILERGIKND